MRPFGILMLTLVLGASVAHAQETPSEWLTIAEAAEDRAEPAEAIEAWRHLIEAAPTSRLAGRARTRIAWMQARNEADFVPLHELMAFLSRAPSTRDEAVVSAFADVTNAMPQGRVRSEARLAVAGEWARLGENDRAHTAWQAALDDPSLEPSEQNLVRESMARALMDSGDLAGAIDELDDADLGSTSLHRVAARRLRAATWLPVSYGLFTAFVLFVLVIVARSGRAKEALMSLRDSPLRVVIALVIGFGPFAIVWWWGDESLDAFRAFAPCSAAIVLLAYLAGEATEARVVRAAVGVLAVIASLAAAYASVALYGEALPFA